MISLVWSTYGLDLWYMWYKGRLRLKDGLEWATSAASW
jgi:hypothetical protein